MKVRKYLIDSIRAIYEKISRLTIANMKPEIHLSLEVVIAIATLFTSVKACEIAEKQTVLVNEQLEVQKQNNLPLFEVHTEVLKVDSLGVNDTEIMRIVNVRESTKGFCRIDIKTYYEVERHRGVDRDTLYVPIRYYFSCQTAVTALKGELTMAFGPSNYSYYHSFYKECMLRSYPMSRAYYFSRCTHLISISYIDIFEKPHRVYFVNNIEVPASDYMRIVNKARDIFSDKDFSVEELKLSDVVSYF